MNSFGRLFRLSIYGESHGSCVGVLIDGCPAGIEISEEDFVVDLDRRRSGKTGTTQRKESDRPILKSGIFKGKTTGAPINIEFVNDDVDSSHYERNLLTARPGHADFVANKKFGGFNDPRGGGHFSGRLTVGLVGAGVIAKKVASPIEIIASLVSVGGNNNLEAAVTAAINKGDSVGGIVECVAKRLPVGLGEPFFDSLEGVLSHALFAIPAIKGVEFGVGFEAARLLGSQMNDPISDISGLTTSNNSGGINGGISNGNDLVFRIAVKPTSSIKIAQDTINIESGEKAQITTEGRHDSCIALRVPPVVEAVTAIVLADFLLINGCYRESGKAK